MKHELKDSEQSIVRALAINHKMDDIVVNLDPIESLRHQIQLLGEALFILNGTLRDYLDSQMDIDPDEEYVEEIY